MAYIPLRTHAAPESIRDFVRLHVDMQLHDVHTMLRLPPTRESGMEGGCNFASVSVLCAVLAGASTVFFRQRARSRERPGPVGRRDVGSIHVGRRGQQDAA
jgi:hypothetical protein